MGCVSMSTLLACVRPLSGQVTEGSGRMLVVAVGTESEWGRTMALVASEAAPTPLQEALGVLATAIGKIGLTVGIICFLVLFARCACGTNPVLWQKT